MKLIFDQRIYRFLIANGLDILASGLFMLALPWLMLQQGASGAFVAITALTGTLSSFLLTPWISIWIDRGSRKRILIYSQMIQVVAALVLFFATQFAMSNLWLLALVQVIYLLCSDLSWSSNNAFQQENYQPQEYAALSAYSELNLQAITMGSAVLGIFLLERWHLSHFALFTALVGLCSIMFYIGVPYKQRPRRVAQVKMTHDLRETFTLVRQRPKFFMLIILSCLSYPMLTYLGKLLPIYLQQYHYDASWIAQWSLMYSLGAFFCGLSIAFLMRQFGLTGLMRVSMLLMMLVLFAMSFLRQPQYLVMLVFLIGLLNPCNRIARTNLIHREVDPNHRGRVDGLLKLFSTLVQSISYCLIAALSVLNMTQWGYSAFALLMMAAVVVMYRLDHFDQEPVGAPKALSESAA